MSLPGGRGMVPVSEEGTVMADGMMHCVAELAVQVFQDRLATISVNAKRQQTTQ